jgi:hypothetical protein
MGSNQGEYKEMGMTAQHAELRSLALNWLANRATAHGIRGATEVFLRKGFIADAAALCSLQARFHQTYCDAWHTDPLTLVTHDHQAMISNYYACVFEIKTSREDYRKTFASETSGRLKPAGSLHWVVTPRGLIEAIELRAPWGLLEIKGAGLAERVIPRWMPMTEVEQDRFAHCLLWPILSGRQEWRQLKAWQRGKEIHERQTWRHHQAAPAAPERNI